MENNPVTDQMKRGEFLRSLGMSSAALMALYCLGTGLTACSKSSDPAPATTPTPPTTSTGLTGNADTSKGAINFTIDLTSANYSKLKTVGEFVNVGSVVVATAKGNKLIAIGRVCPHQGGSLEYKLQPDLFKCNLHGSEFSDSGKVQPGWDAKSNVAEYKTTLSTDGTKLTVTA